MASKKSAFNNFVDVIKNSVDRGALSYSDWIATNFTHPKNNLQNWSWKDHEFQIEIFDQGADVRSSSVIKPAQVGLSEGTIRWGLAFSATNDFLKIAYVLPTASFAASFAATRVSPAIENSPLVKALVSTDTDNVKYKKIGSCFLFMLGTSGEKSGISVDLDALIVDEKNFCNMTVLQTMNSRLIHSKLKLYRSFSTPTLTNFGISSDYDNGSQAVRLCKCDHCGSWEELTWDSIEIPGFTQSIKDFNVQDAKHPGVKEAYLKCMSCKRPLSINNLNDPAKRQWVHKNTERFKDGIKSYQVTPWDVPTVNLVPEVLGDVAKYGKEKWTQFRMGHAYDSADNSFLYSSMTAYALNWDCAWKLEDMWLGRYRTARTCYFGVDLGKHHNYLTVGVENDHGGMDVVGAFIVTQEMIREKCDGDVVFGKYLEKLGKCVRLGKGITDHAPAYEVALHLITHGDKRWFGSYYKGASSSTNPDIYKFNDLSGTVTIQVNENFTEMAALVNSGVIRFIQEDFGDYGELFRHFSAMKKQRTENAKGQAVEEWIAVKLNGAESVMDHFAHSVGYCYAAFASSEKRDSGDVFVPDMGWLVRLAGKDAGVGGSSMEAMLRDEGYGSLMVARGSEGKGRSRFW
jgi:hypothetical protein